MLNCFQFCFNFAFNFNLRCYMKEAQAINKSLSALGDVISALATVGRCRLTLSNPS